MKKCKTCGQINVRERNGIAVSKYCTACRKQKELEKKEKHKTTKGYEQKLKKKLMRKAWGLMSEWIRRKDALKSGQTVCYTCRKMDHYKNMHCGHLFHGKLDLDERNLKCQCPHCNLYLSGNHVLYTLRLVDEIGVEGVQEVKREANIRGNNYTVEELELIIADLEQKLSKLNTSE